MMLLKRLQILFQPLKSHLVLRGLLGGLGMGIIGALLPLTLFSGEAETHDLINHAAEIGVLMLVVLCLAKLLATSLVLATGWKGGYIFPIMFAGVSLGLRPTSYFPVFQWQLPSQLQWQARWLPPARSPVCRAADDHAGPAGDCPRDRRRGGGQRVDGRVGGSAHCPQVSRSGRSTSG